jgi:DNA ligase-1
MNVMIACYEDDDEEYQTICKIGTGFKDEDLNTLSATLRDHEIEAPRQYYVISDAPVHTYLLTSL